MDNKGYLIASLVGTKLAEKMGRVSEVQNELMKHPVPRVPFVPNQNEIEINKVNSSSFNSVSISKDTTLIANQFAPLKVKSAGSSDDFIQLPFEPLISITGKNNIIRRSIAKAPNYIGSVKEHWSQDDYQIQITGILIGENQEGDFGETYPLEYFEKLRELCKSPSGLEVQCDLLQSFEIKYIVVEEFSFPFTKGENVQAYDIKAYSDFTPIFFQEIID